MANLPSQHPHLALHLSDRALTPIISSSTSSLSRSHPQAPSPSSRPTPSASGKRPPTFSTSPPSSLGSAPASPTSAPEDDDDTDDSDADPAAAAAEIDPQTLQSLSLAHLTTTALASYDAAKRLDRGAPLRTMVEYAVPGPVVLHSYMCPMSLALGVPGLGRRDSRGSISTTGVGPADDSAGGGGGGRGYGEGAGDGGDGEGQGRPLAGAEAEAARPPRLHADDVDDGDGDGEGNVTDDADGPNAPPMLISTVVAPGADDLRDARRAAGRLERIATAFQTEWAAEGVDAT